MPRNNRRLDDNDEEAAVGVISLAPAQPDAAGVSSSSNKETAARTPLSSKTPKQPHHQHPHSAESLKSEDSEEEEKVELEIKPPLPLANDGGDSSSDDDDDTDDGAGSRVVSLASGIVTSRHKDNTGPPHRLHVPHSQVVQVDDNNLESLAEEQQANAPLAVEQGNSNNNNNNTTPPDTNTPVIKLYKSSRLKSYITLTLASFINYDATEKSGDISGSAGGVPSTSDERAYADAASLISLSICGAAVLMHLDRITPLEKAWIAAFQPKSRWELGLALFLVVWWTTWTGVQTSLNGLAGDGKAQYSFYFSAWACLITSYGLLDEWLIASSDSRGKSGMKAFVASWPHRAPAWICIMVLSFCALIWYLDLWQNHDKLDAETEQTIRASFEKVGEGHWLWLISISTMTTVVAAAFVLVELFRETKEDGSSQIKGRGENIVEGVCLSCLALAWIPTVVLATTPGGPASFPGNAYFFTWLPVIFVFEGLVWFIHDMRKELHRALKEKEEEYRRRQRRVLEDTKRIQRRRTKNNDAAAMWNHTNHEPSSSSPRTRATPKRERADTDYFDTVSSPPLHE